MKHTPGKWEAIKGRCNESERLGDVWGTIYSSEESVHVATIEDTYTGAEEANAALIAAAPELLEALKAALEWIDAVPKETVLPAMPGFDRDWVNGIIQKAEGR